MRSENVSTSYRVWFFLLICSLCFSYGCAGLPTHPSQLRYKPIRFSPPKPERMVLENGLILYLMEDHEIPFIDGLLLTRTGAIYEPAEKLGLAAMTGSVMRTGGTPDITGDEIDRELETLAASIEVAISREQGSASFSAFSKDTDRVLKLFGDFVLRPAFRDEKIDLKRKEMLDDIRRQNDEPPKVASREFYYLVYGKENPWVRLPNVKTVSSITKEDLIDFHQKSFRPNGSILAISGDFRKDELLKKIREIFAEWQPQKDTFSQIEPLSDDATKPGVYFVNKDIAQVNIRMGHLGISRKSPDFFAVQLLNFILGDGGFNARLMQKVRSELGLAYAVWGSVGVGTDRGIFTVGAETKTESAGLAIKTMRDIVDGMTREVPTDEEIFRAKETLSNQFIFLYDSSLKIARQNASLEYFDYPKDYLDTYLSNIAKVTPEDILNAGKKYLHPNEMVIFAVGKSDQISASLGEIGSLQEIHLDPAE